jgi:hypothetical protein
MEVVLQQVSYNCSLADILQIRTVNKWSKALIEECIYYNMHIGFKSNIHGPLKYLVGLLRVI